MALAFGYVASRMDVFEQLRWLPWFHRPLPIARRAKFWFLRPFTASVLFSTVMTVLCSIAVVQVQEELDLDPMGGDGWAFLFTAQTFLIGIFVTEKLNRVNRVRDSINKLQQHVSHVMKHPKQSLGATEYKSFSNTRNSIISIIRDLSVHTYYEPQTHVAMRFENEFLKTRDLGAMRPAKSVFDEPILEGHVNTIMSMRMSYAYTYMEGFIYLTAYLMLTVYYPILLRQTMNHHWTWIPSTFLLCLADYSLIEVISIANYDMEAWGVTPMPIV
jgi:hypothetical protein